MTAFNARKAAQVITYFALKAQDRKLPVIKAVKLVYLSDRDSIQHWGAPILDEPHVAMPHGPVNSYTYAHINGEYDHMISATEDVTADDLDELSEADIQCLERTWQRFGQMNRWELRDWTHDRNNVPEWEDPSGSSNPIPLERIMTMVGVDRADERAAFVRDHSELDRIFRNLREADANGCLPTPRRQERYDF
jgi:uncharacterized phage-associated protein